MPICLASCGISAQPVLAQEVYGPPDTEAESIITDSRVELFPLTSNEAEVVPPRSYKQFLKEKRQRNWEKVKPVEMFTQAWLIADPITTDLCLNTTKGQCIEKNTRLLGSEHPSRARIYGTLGAFAVAHWFFTREVAKRSPEAAALFDAITLAKIGPAVIGNIRLIKKY